jgi:hypothetical protein
MRVQADSPVPLKKPMKALCIDIHQTCKKKISLVDTELMTISNDMNMSTYRWLRPALKIQPA